MRHDSFLGKFCAAFELYGKKGLADRELAATLQEALPMEMQTTESDDSRQEEAKSFIKFVVSISFLFFSHPSISR